MRSTISLLLFLLLGFSACERDIKITLPDQPSKLVMKAVVRVGASITVDLSRTRSIRETQINVPTHVDGATVVLYVNGQAADTLEGFPAERVTTYMSTIVAEAGKTYRLVIKAAGFDDIQATAAAPVVVPVQAWDLKPNARQHSDGITLDAFSFTFGDPAASKDYYVGQLIPAFESGTETDFYAWRNCVYTSDPSVESGSGSDDPFGDEDCISSNSILVDDALFSGAEKKLTLYAYTGMLSPQEDWSGSKTYAHAWLWHVSEDFYRYLISYRQVRDTEGNPFAEPANIATNVKGGYGIFAIIDAAVLQIDL